MISSIAMLSNIANAGEITICGNKTQGSILQGAASEDITKIYLDSKEIKISSDKKFIIAFSRDDSLNHKIKTIDNKKQEKEYGLSIAETKWDIESLTGVEQKKVTPSENDQVQIKKERTAIRLAQVSDQNYPYWKENFIIPTIGRISGNFGNQRIMNGKKMNPHMGMDIAAVTGTDIKAPADGIITLSGMENYFYSGNVVIIDHGHKLFTIYAHMNDIVVKNGDKVKQGDIIGYVGKTGRVTGPHLHWGASLENIRFDPKQLLEKDINCEILK